ncbi:MAG TPA: ribonuclease HI [Chloroflexota bacterium]
MIVAYTDGACIGNPGPGGWAAIVDRDGAREEISGAAPNTTNNRMELTAAIEALRRVPPDAPVRVVTDSQYVMKGITSWVAGWRKRGWRTATGGPVLNQDLWEALAALADARVSWEWVRGHAGHPENERVDRLARAQAASVRAATPGARGVGGSPNGVMGGDGASLGRGISEAAALARSAVGRARGAAGRARGSSAAPGGWPTYLSLVDGRLMRHRDWPSCERRVHGRRGARFKKCRSADEERTTVAGWRLPATALAALAAD